jgi:hypothetical protein
VSLPVALSEALTARAAAEGSSAIRVIIDAVKAGVGRLDDLVAAERTLRGEGAAGDDLFDVPGHRPWNEPLTVRDLTTTQRNISVLTELANKHAGENRSLLITAVLRDYLD